MSMAEYKALKELAVEKGINFASVMARLAIRKFIAESRM